MIARLFAWVENELRLLGLDSWADGQYAGPQPCSHDDPACIALEMKQAEARTKMIAERVPLLAISSAERLLGASRRQAPGDFLAHTDVKATLDAIKRVNAPPVRLAARKVK